MRLVPTSAIAVVLSCPLAPGSVSASDDTPATTRAPVAADEPEAKPPVFYETTTVTARPVSSATARSRSSSRARWRGLGGPQRHRASCARCPASTLLRSGSRAGVTNAYVRGGDPNFTLVLLDGIPLNDSTELQGGAVNLEELPGRPRRARGDRARPAHLVLRDEQPRRRHPALHAPRRAGARARRASAPRPATPTCVRGVRAGVGASGTRRLRRPGPLVGRGAAPDRARTASGSSTPSRARTCRSGRTTDLRLTARFADGEHRRLPRRLGRPRLRERASCATPTHRDLALGARSGSATRPADASRLIVGLSRRERRTARARPCPRWCPESSEQHDVHAAAPRVAGAALPHGPAPRWTPGPPGEGEWGENASVLKLPPFLGGDVPGDYRETRGERRGLRRGPRLERGALGPLRGRPARRRRDGDCAPARTRTRASSVRPGAGSTRLRASVGPRLEAAELLRAREPAAPSAATPTCGPSARGAARRGSSTTSRRRASTSAPRTSSSEYQRPRRLRLRPLPPREPRARAHAGRRAHRPLAAPPRRSRSTPRPRTSTRRTSTAASLLHEPRWTGGGRLTWQPDERLSLRLQARARSRATSTSSSRCPTATRSTATASSASPARGASAAASSLRARLDNLTDRVVRDLHRLPRPRPVASGWASAGTRLAGEPRPQR